MLINREFERYVNNIWQKVTKIVTIALETSDRSLQPLLKDSKIWPWKGLIYLTARCARDTEITEFLLLTACNQSFSIIENSQWH